MLAGSVAADLVAVSPQLAYAVVVGAVVAANLVNRSRVGSSPRMVERRGSPSPTRS